MKATFQVKVIYDLPMLEDKQRMVNYVEMIVKDMRDFLADDDVIALELLNHTLVIDG
jgi:hypothetical protein